MRAVGVLLLWEDLTDDQCVGDLLTSVGRDFIVVDNEEGIRPLVKLPCFLCVLSYPLEEAAHLIRLGRGPGGGVLGVFTELAILHELARLFIEYWQCHGTGDGCVCPLLIAPGHTQPSPVP